MPTSTVPFKTPLGHEELRSRAQKLGQRHRTLLFLIDGRRPLAEVLMLAHKAGAATQHFEDLLRMGLVELPPDPTPPELPAIPVLTDEAALTSVELVVVPQEIPDAAGGEALPPLPPPPPPVVEVRRVAVPDLPVLRDLPEDPFERTVRQTERFIPDPAKLPVLKITAEDPFERTQRLPGPPSADAVQRRAPVPAAEAVPAVKRKPLAPALEVEPKATVLITSERLTSKAAKGRSAKSSGRKSTRHVPVLLEPVVPPQVGAVASTQGPTLIDPVLHDPAPRKPVAKPVPVEPPKPALDIHLPIADGEEARLLQRVRDHLTDALRLDAPVFSARTFMRVRSAQSRSELIDLVWEIQDHLSRRRRSPKELASLHEARELLGLGNTLVAGDDSRPDYLDDE
ncbi:hypothetical protein [Piscinibacter terrae]|uniref:Uncharacterized protein n=1 Tax=Piscinibacter terrae TaxID=2496871 RepID=A0A3N7HSA2_9BURK|nr:hypothetical protein [Albitalea terrae]RQP25157.1 hypothetical protein DZC73_09930 [Albitalea terrae]